MSAPLRDPTWEPIYSSLDANDDFEDRFALSPGERIGQLSSGKSDALAWGISLAIIVCAGWVLTRDTASWITRITDATARVSAALDQNPRNTASPQNIASATSPPAPQSMQPPVSTPQPAPPTAGAATPTPTSAPVANPVSPTANAPASSSKNDTAKAHKPAAASDDKPATDDIKTAALPSPKHNDDAETSDLPAPKAKPRDDAMSDYSPARSELPQPHDRYQVRAEAAGLHPGLSRAVLARFSPTDFRNARTAINTAVARTPDNGTFIWPRRREPGRALFKVHFVAGAPPDCRRYVVTVTMAGWTTTALPMEKCGVRARVAEKR